MALSFLVMHLLLCGKFGQARHSAGLGVIAMLLAHFR